VTLPETGLHVSQLCLGSTDIGSSIGRAESFDLLDAYWDAGGNFIDTAAVYANWLPGERSISEKTIGAWMQGRRNRQQMVIATKGAHYDLATPHLLRCSPDDIVADLEASLRHLQTDVIDLYYLHRDDPSRPVAEILDTLAGQARMGKIRYFGCSNWRTARVSAAQEYARTQGMVGFVANQMMWSLAQIDASAFSDPTMCAMDDEMWRYHMETGLAAIPYSSQANGLFQKMAMGRSDRLSAGQQRLYAGKENHERGRRVQELAAETGLTVTQVVLGYLLSQPFTTVPIVGCKTTAHLRDSLTAADVRLSPDQVRLLVYGPAADRGR
jgi:aryl-alcohol dehydrogenase-like predicted oxidoreductase